ncbi:hypothetical protein EYF80_058014 [Liparis tanakae]|uniref:Uncharacterized protein n=1 Tax=Liparis tanakae TaxID=230148 RepID=A0A4Z2ESC1_9TELE|nr:hypothetical protein EYF80_058014 [Liparis tanakae]
MFCWSVQHPLIGRPEAQRDRRVKRAPCRMDEGDGRTWQPVHDEPKASRPVTRRATLKVKGHQRAPIPLAQSTRTSATLHSAVEGEERREERRRRREERRNGEEETERGEEKRREEKTERGEETGHRVPSAKEIKSGSRGLRRRCRRRRGGDEAQPVIPDERESYPRNQHREEEQRAPQGPRLLLDLQPHIVHSEVLLNRTTTGPSGFFRVTPWKNLQTRVHFLKEFK